MQQTYPKKTPHSTLTPGVGEDSVSRAKTAGLGDASPRPPILASGLGVLSCVGMLRRLAWTRGVAHVPASNREMPPRPTPTPVVVCVCLL